MIAEKHKRKHKKPQPSYQCNAIRFKQNLKGPRNQRLPVYTVYVKSFQKHTFPKLCSGKLGILKVHPFADPITSLCIDILIPYDDLLLLSSNFTVI